MGNHCCSSQDAMLMGDHNRPVSQYGENTSSMLICDYCRLTTRRNAKLSTSQDITGINVNSDDSKSDEFEFEAANDD